MRALDRKLLRDLWRTRAQVVSIAAVLAGGVMAVVAIGGAAASLERGRTAYYAAGHFADVFASLTRAPDEVAGRLAAIPGVAQVATRGVKEVRIDVVGLERPGMGRLISLPSPRAAAAVRLNVVRVLRGRAVRPDAEDEVLVNGRFADANHLEPGDSLVAVINERRTRLRIVGIAGAPDFLYEGGTSGMVSDERAFALLWAPFELTMSATGMRGAFNDVAIGLASGVPPAHVLPLVDSILAPYGSRGAVARSDQLSHRVVQNELHQLAVMGWAFPVFFVAVAAFLAGTVLSRLVTTEREQIAIVKAFGYSSTSIAAHYLAYAAAAVALGIGLGVAVGAWAGRAFTNLYTEILRIPDLRFQPDWAAVGASVALLGIAALGGAARAVRAAALLSPAEGMRAPAPARFRALLLDRLGMGRALPASARMVLRGLERRPTRAMLGAAGVAAALAMMAGSLSLYDASSRMVELQFGVGHRETLAVGMLTDVPNGTRESFARLPGVTRVELTRTVPVRLRHAGRARTLALTGVEAGGTLFRLVDMQGHAYPVPPTGVVMSRSLARALDARPGDVIVAELLEDLTTRPVVVAAVLDEIMSPNAYMELGALGQLTMESAPATGAYLRTAGPPSPALFAALRDMPRVATVSSRQAMLETFDRMMARNFRVSATLIVVFASVIAMGVVYNGARIALSERGRELASLRVLGFTTREVGTLLLGEQALLALAAVPLGWSAGWLFAGYLARSFESEEYQVPLVTHATTYGFATVVVLLASAIAGVLMYRRAARLDLVAVLKTRE